MEHNSAGAGENEVDDLFVVDTQPSYGRHGSKDAQLSVLGLGNPKSIEETTSGRGKNCNYSDSPEIFDFIPINEEKKPLNLKEDRTSEVLELDNNVTLEENVLSKDSLMVIEDKEGLLTGQKSNTPTYKVNDLFQSQQGGNESSQKKNKFMNGCWNCNETSHSLRECTKARDHRKIARARKEFLDSRGGSRQAYKRYHLEESQRYCHLVPGKISDELAAALGLESRQLPSHVYMMRLLGYPPGWLHEATVSHSGIGLFDGSGKEGLDTDGNCGKDVEDEKFDKYDINKLIRYPGFNAPPPLNTYDDSNFWRVPPQSHSQSLEVMVERLQGRTVGSRVYGGKRKKLSFGPSTQSDATLNSSLGVSNEMDFEEMPDCEDLPEDNCKFIPPLPEEDLPTPPPPPAGAEDSISDDANSSQSAVTVHGTTLVELEQSKKQILAELNDTTPLCATPESQVGKIKSVNLGTPIIESVSPFSTLPSAKKFSVDICDVINFENLPNSTGKYKQMSGLIGKVRTKLAELEDEQ